MKRLLRRLSIVLGLPFLAYGLYVSAKTIQLYAFGSEAQGTIVKFQLSHVPRGSRLAIRRPFEVADSDFGPTPQRFAVVRHATEQGQTESRVRIDLRSTLEIDEPVTVIYLPGSSWAAIRGEAVYQQMLLLPLSFLIVGCIITGFSLTAGRPIFVRVRQPSGTNPAPDAPPASPSRPKGVLDAIGLRLFWGGLIAGIGGIAYLILFELGSHAWKSYQGKMRHEETLYAPLVAEGISVASPNIKDPANICPPMEISAVSRDSATSGDIIELQGNWGALTSNKVPEMRGRRAVRRLKVIEWTANAIRLEVPAGLEPGSYSVGVRCYFRPDQPKSRIRYSGSLKIQIK